MLFNVVFPEIVNELLIVDAPETNKLVKLVLFNNDVLVEFKLLIDNVEALDKLFKLLNIVVQGHATRAQSGGRLGDHFI
jgi:hypothetical protein